MGSIQRTIHLLLLRLLPCNLRLHPRHQLWHRLIIRIELLRLCEIILRLVIKALLLPCGRPTEEGLDTLLVERQRLITRAYRLIQMILGVCNLQPAHRNV